jgi:hypothetical protein
MGKKKTSEIAIRKQSQPREQKTVSMDTLISQAIKEKATVETFKELFELQKKIQEQVAAKAYRESMSKFQAECPIIKKTKIVSDKNGKVRYKYAPLESIIKQTQGGIARNGFSYHFNTAIIENGMDIIFTITHIMGHKEETHFPIPFETSEYMNVIQRAGSTLTYGKRYAFCDGFGISTADEDTDGGNPPDDKKKIDEEAKARRERLDKLSDKVKEGFKLLGYGEKAQYAGCEKYKWDEVVILKTINEILDKQEKAKESK